MSYAKQRPRPGPQRGTRSQERAAAKPVRQRALDGEPCWFYGKRPECPGPGWWWDAPPNHPWEFTTHHLHRVMDGGPPVTDPDLMVPAHRGCNAWDGLTAQNNRRRGIPSARTTNPTERTSRNW